MEDGRLRHVTRDHGFGALDNGQEPDAGSAAQTRALGAESELFIDGVIAPNRPGTRFLLCSDGLNKELSDAELERTMNMRGESPGILPQLVDLAMTRTARDNVSTIVVTLDA